MNCNSSLKHKRSFKNQKRKAQKFGVYVCDENGLAIRCFNRLVAAYSWLDKHYSNLSQDEKKKRIWRFNTKKAVNHFFDTQMSLGLTDKDIIACLLWYCGISQDTSNLDLNNGRLKSILHDQPELKGKIAIKQRNF